MNDKNYINEERLMQLQHEVFNIATEQGFYKRLLSKEFRLILIMTEISNAVDNFEHNSRADIVSFNERLAELDGSDECFKQMYKRYIKYTLEDKFANIIFRLVELAAYVHGYKMKWSGYDSFGNMFNSDKTFYESAWFFVREVLNWNKTNIIDSVSYICAWADYLGIDVNKYVELKIRYEKIICACAKIYKINS